MFSLYCCTGDLESPCWLEDAQFAQKAAYRSLNRQPSFISIFISSIATVPRQSAQSPVSISRTTAPAGDKSRYQLPMLHRPATGPDTAGPSRIRFFFSSFSPPAITYSILCRGKSYVYCKLSSIPRIRCMLPLGSLPS